jgi:hypothetical protein
MCPTILNPFSSMFRRKRNIFVARNYDRVTLVKSLKGNWAVGYELRVVVEKVSVTSQ